MSDEGADEMLPTAAAAISLPAAPLDGEEMLPYGRRHLSRMRWPALSYFGVLLRLLPQFRFKFISPFRSHSRMSEEMPVPPPVNDDLLGEILLRLPLQPSSLPRASLVCKPWRHLATDPAFLRRFRAHHRNPPILGFFQQRGGELVFIPVLDPPDRIPHERFSLRVCDGRAASAWSILGCRHGRVLIFSWKHREFLVFDPVSRDRRTMAVPPDFIGQSEFDIAVNGAVLCSAGDDTCHVHGSCHRSPFKVILVGTRSKQPAFARVYSSESGIWGDLISTVEPCIGDVTPRPCTLVGSALYWWLTKAGNGILELDLDSQSLAVINKPRLADIHSGSSWIVQGDDGGVRLAILSYPLFHMLDRKVDSHGVAAWVLHETFDMYQILELSSKMFVRMANVLAYSEDADAIFLSVDIDGDSNFFILRLVSMQPTQICGNFLDDVYRPFTSFYHPFTSFYAASPPLLQLPASMSYILGELEHRRMISGGLLGLGGSCKLK